MRRWWGVVLAAGVAGVLIASSPLLLARLAARRLTAALGTDVAVGSLGWSPLTGQWVAADVRVAGRPGTTVSRIRRVRMRLSVRELLGGEVPDLRDVLLEAPHVTLIRDGDGWRLDLPSPPSSPEDDAGWPAIRLDGVEGRHAIVTLDDPGRGRTVVRVKHVQFQGVSGATGVQGHLAGTGRVGDGSFTVRAALRLGASSHRFRLHVRAANVALAPTLAFARIDPGREVAGRADVQASYDDGAHGTHRHRTISGSLTATDFGVGAGNERGVRLPRLDVSRFRIDPERRAIVMERVATSRGEMHVRRLPEGVRVAGVFEPGTRTAAGPPAWTLDVAEVVARNIDIQDDGADGRALAKVTELRAGPIGARAHPIPVSVTADLPSGGHLQAAGTASMDPVGVRLRLTAEDVNVTPLGSAAGLPVALLSGRANGTFDVVAGAGKTQLSGEVAIDDLKTAPADGDRPEHVLACKRLAVTIDAAALRPLRVSLARVAVEWPYVFFDRTAAGLFPLSLLHGAAGAGPRPDIDGDWIRIGDVTVTGGRVDFRDETLTPPYWRSLASVTARAHDVTAAPARVAKLSLDGLVDELSPLHVDGSVGARTELQLTAQQLALPPFNAYLRDLSSYSVASGIVEVRSEIVIERSALEATNRVVLSRLGMQGSGREDPLQQQIGLPLTLAIALMKDYRGNIALDLPVRGDLASSRFSLRSSIMQAIVQAIRGAVLSPLNVLGRVFLRDGRIERFTLEPVSFAPGSRTLNAAGTERVAQVAHVLLTRPDLAVEIRGAIAAVDIERLQDGQALAALGEERDSDRLRAYLRARVAGEDPPPLKPDDQSQLDTLRRGLPWPGDVARALAVDRSQTVAATLAVEHGVEGKRLVVGEPDVGPGALAEAPGAALALRER